MAKLDFVWVARQHIDIKSYDAFLLASHQGVVYSQSWYLDIVTNKNWYLLQIFRDGELVGQMPVPFINRFFFDIALQPFFSQQLGPVSDRPYIDFSIDEVITAIKQKFPAFLLVGNFNTSLINSQSSTFTHLLDLNASYENIASNYFPSMRRNLRKANLLTLSENGSIDRLISLFKTMKQHQVSEVKERHYGRLKQLYFQGTKLQQVKIFEVHSADGELLASAMLLFWREYITYLFGISSVAGRKVNAMSVLLDGVIKQNAGNALVFDFEGGNNKGIGDFYKSFGAKAVEIPVWKHNGVTPLLRKLVPF